MFSRVGKRTTSQGTILPKMIAAPSVETFALKNKNWDKENPINTTKGRKWEKLYEKAEQIRNNKLARMMLKHISNLFKCN